MDKVKKGICGMCQGGCEVNIFLRNEKIVKLEPVQDSPRGRLCVRGALAPKILYEPYRLSSPLIRTGARGEGKFRRASWDESLDLAAQLLRKVADQYGGRALASYMGRGVLGMPVTRMGKLGLGGSKNTPAFLSNLDSPNDMSCNSICNIVSSMMMPITTVGIVTRQMVQDIEHSDYIIAWGKNSTTDEGPQITLARIKTAQARGAKLIVIDPRETGLGEIADYWFPVIPGADGALALAMLKLIIDHDRYDHDFVRDFTRGFEEFRDYLDTLSLENLSRWCGISIEQIQVLVDLFCSTEKISLISHTGLEYQYSALQNGRALFVLWAITNKLDKEGAIYLDVREVPTFVPYPVPREGAPLGAEQFPLFYGFMRCGQFSFVPKAVLEDDPYPVRGLLIVGGSPALSFPESRKWRRAYEKLECLIVLDRYLTEDARYADVVFPACSLFECPKEIVGPNGPLLIEASIPPVAEARNDLFIMQQIAERLGFGHLYPKDDAEMRAWLHTDTTPFVGDFCGKKGVEEWRYQKYKTGELREDGRPGFPTPSGKFEICSVLLEDYGFTPYPEYQDISSAFSFDTNKFPFMMTTGARSNHRMGVFGPNIPEVAAVEPYPFADIAPEDAAELDIEDGEWVRVTTPFGSGKYKTRIFGMARHSIHIPHGGGSVYMSDAWHDGNVNDLCSLEQCDPLTGFVTIKTVPCRVDKV